MPEGKGYSNHSDGPFAKANDTDEGNTAAVQARVANMYKADSGYGNGGHEVETGPDQPISVRGFDSAHQAAFDNQGQGRSEHNQPMHPTNPATSPTPGVDYQSRRTGK